MSLHYIYRVTELTKIGYVFCEKTRWWWCKERKCAVDDRTIHLAYDNFMDKVLNSENINDHIMYSLRRINRDILDTIYYKHFPQAKLLPKGGL